jgi:hypothetical protein
VPLVCAEPPAPLVPPVPVPPVAGELLVASPVPVVPVIPAASSQKFNVQSLDSE